MATATRKKSVRARKWRQAVSELSGAITLFPIPMKFVVPAIGQSFDLLGGQPGEAIALDVGGDQLRKTPSQSEQSRFFYVKDTRSFSDALDFSMSAGGGGWGASYGMTAAASSLLKTSSLTQTIHFRAVTQTSQSMVKPDAVLSAEAAKVLAQGRQPFLDRFGTHFVAGYVYGKSCNLSYHLVFSTLDLATKFSASFSESESALGLGESMSASITNTLNIAQSHCQFSVEADYRGFKSISPETMTDLAKVRTDYDAAAGDSTGILLIVCPWTYLDQVHAAFNAAGGLPINDPLAELAALTNKLLYIKQTGQNFINSNRYAGGSQWKAITDAEQPVQKELNEILAFLKKCNGNSASVTEDDVDKFAPAEPLLDQMNTALRRFCLAFSVVLQDWLARPILPAAELSPQSNAFQLSSNGHQLSTLYNGQKGVWFEWSGSHNLCSVEAGGVWGFTSDADNGTLVAWFVPVTKDVEPQMSHAIQLNGSTNSRSLGDANNHAKLYWSLQVQGMTLELTLCPV